MRKRKQVLSWLGVVLGMSAVGGGAASAYADEGHAPAATQAADAPAFSFDTVIAEAQALAAKPYDDRPPVVPAALESMTYDQFRKIQHKRDEAVWAKEGLPFRIMFFHRGWLHKQQVVMSLVTPGEGEEPAKAEVVPYHSEWFEYHDSKMGPLPDNLGFAGFKVLYELNTPGKFDELVSFLGASYFRPLAKGQHYGLSARGLAIDTGLPSGEEFPAFRKYWLVQPAKDAKTLTFYALLDSHSVAGAYRFDITPLADGSHDTVIDIDTHLFPRTAIQKLGVAPLTSMYLYGEAEVRPVFDFRPEVHDSDGLLIADNNGEWIWRPLANPRHTRVSALQFKNLRGFGLMQRDREFLHYQDLEAEYHIRPSAWVEPIDGFGAGKIDLLEIASDDEGMDNIVAQYVENAPVQAGSRLHYQYRMRVMDHGPVDHVGGKATATRRMWRPEGFVHKTITVPEGAMRFLIDFEGPTLEGLDVAAIEEAESMKVIATATNATVSNQVAQHNRVTGHWRAFFDVTPTDAGKPIELRAFLKNGDDYLTETWSYTWNP